MNRPRKRQEQTTPTRRFCHPPHQVQGRTPSPQNQSSRKPTTSSLLCISSLRSVLSEDRRRTPALAAPQGLSLEH